MDRHSPGPVGRVPRGTVIQIVSVLDSAGATGTTAVPNDDSPPQNNEGDEFMTLNIIPRNPSNTLIIQVVFNFSHSGGTQESVSLFQDAIGNALATSLIGTDADNHRQASFNHVMIAGTDAEIAFKVRAGGAAGSTTTFNGAAGSRTGGGVAASSIIIWEIAS